MSNERKTNMFTKVPVQNVSRNMFDLSHEVKMSGKFGWLYPILCVDTLPGDSFRDKTNILLRFAPLLAPVMHRCDVTTHFFFVPNRILWDDWQLFITGGRDGTEAPVPPFVTPNGLYAATGGGESMAKGSIWDYLGLPVADFDPTPPAVISNEQVSALPFYAVAKVWNDWYRDPNLLFGTLADPATGELPIPKEVNGNVSANTSVQNILYGLTAEAEGYLRRGFEKDYFTSALPFAQRGAQVLMPLSGTAEAADIDYLPVSEVYSAGGGTPVANANLNVVGGNQALFTQNAGTIPGRIENIDSITFENAATTINDLRLALAVQRWMENNARGGARYTEQILSHFNVQVPDYTLQRSEYLGGGKQPVQISEVLATAEADEVPVGDMKGHGLSVGSSNSWTYRCDEHGWVIGFMSVTMRTAYSQGIPRKFTRREKFDYAFPELANLGEQTILSKEVFFSYDNADTAGNDSVFGYIPRYADYKFHNDRIAGDFRDTLGFWHLGRQFTVRPALDVNFTTIFEDGDFVTTPAVPDSYEESFRRIFAVDDGTDYLWIQMYHHLTAKRPLPYFGVPRILG